MIQLVEVIERQMLVEFLAFVRFVVSHFNILKLKVSHILKVKILVFVTFRHFDVDFIEIQR